MAAHYVVRSVDRAQPEIIAALRETGVATAHEAAGRTGLLGPTIQARQAGTTIAGSAITVSCPPGDNLMVHAAVEVCRPGDVLIVTTALADDDGGLVLPAASGPAVLDAATKRLTNEADKRKRLAGGELGVDLYQLRPLLAELGVEYVDRLPDHETRPRDTA